MDHGRVRGRRRLALAGARAMSGEGVQRPRRAGCLGEACPDRLVIGRTGRILPRVRFAHDQTLRSCALPGESGLHGIVLTAVAELGLQHAARRATRNSAEDHLDQDEGVVAGRRDLGVTAGLACGNWVQLRAWGVWRGQRRGQCETWTGSPDLGRAGDAAAEDSAERSPRLCALHDLNPVIHARPGRCAPAVEVKVLHYAPRLATANDALEDLDPYTMSPGPLR